MTIDEIVEQAIQGHASTRDSIRWAINQELEACAKVCDGWPDYDVQGLAEAIRARGDA